MLKSIQGSWNTKNILPAHILKKSATVLASILIISYLPNWLPFLFPLVNGSSLVWPIIYYSTLLAVGGTAMWYFVFDEDIRRKVAPLAYLCVMSLLPLILHMSGNIWKNYFIAIYLLFSLTVLVLAVGVRIMSRLTASIVTFNAVLCLVASAFPDSFTNTIGRTAGLHINPNVYSVSLLLGAVVTVWAVPRKLQFSYLVLIGFALIPPLSRSTMVSAAILAVVASPFLVRRWKSDWVQLRYDLRRSCVLASVLLIWLLISFSSNDRFQVASQDAFSGLKTAIEKYEKTLLAAKQPIDRLMRKLFLSKYADGTIANKRAVVHLEEMNTFAKQLEKENSASSRILLLERSLLVYRIGPLLGQGLDVSHDLHPHNSYLLFAVAFGHFGWLIIISFLALAFYYNRGLKGAIFALAMALATFFSHDIFLMPGLIGFIAVGYAGLIAQNDKQLDQNIGRNRYLGRSILAGGAVAILGLLVLLSTRSTLEVAIEKEEIQKMEGNIYYHLLEQPSYSGIFRVKANIAAADNNSDEEKILFIDNQSRIKGGTNWSDRIDPVEWGHFWRYKRRTLIFTTNDGTDPRTNKRKYRVIVPIEIHPLFYLLLSLTLAWTIMSARWLGIASKQGKGQN